MASEANHSAETGAPKKTPTNRIWRRLIGLAICLAIAVSVAVILRYKPWITRYEGKLVSEWVAQSTSRNAEDRMKAVIALGNFKDEAEKSVPALIERLTDDDPKIQRKAVEALGKIGPAAITPLIEILDDDDPDIRF